MDRVALPDDRIDSSEVGSCEGCGGTVYAYEATTCASCDAAVHTNCEKTCHICRSHGCRMCLVQDPDTQKWTCKNCTLGELDEESK